MKKIFVTLCIAVGTITSHCAEYQDRLSQILDPSHSGLYDLLEWQDIQKHFSDPAQKAAIELFLRQLPPQIDDSKKLYKQVAPALSKRIRIYNESADGSMLLRETFKKKNIETVIDLVALNGYLSFLWLGYPIPEETIELGALIDQNLVKLLREFFIIDFLQNGQKGSYKDFLEKYQVLGWADRLKIGERIYDGLYWRKALENPSAIMIDEWANSTGARRYRDLIKQLTIVAQEEPSLAGTALQKIAELEEKLAPLSKQQENEHFIDLFLEEGEIGSIQGMIAFFMDPQYASALAWEIDHNGTHKEKILAKLSEISRFYQRHNFYSGFIELVENLPLKPETKAALFGEQIRLYLEKLTSSFVTLETTLKA